MKHFLTPFSFAALLLSFLSSSTLSAQNTISGTIQSGGLTREYRLYIPAAYRAGTPVPLLFNLHGLGSNNVEQEAYGDFRPIADTANFIIVHPNGVASLFGRGWNVVGAPGTGSNANDVAFLSALLDKLRTEYSINPNRVYSTGMSNGGFMSYELACHLSGRIAAVASVTGSMGPDRLDPTNAAFCTPQHPVPVLEIHGTADNTVRYEGGLAFGIVATAPIPSVLDYWRNFNGTAATPTVTTLPNTNTADNSTVERQVWTGGRNGSVVHHLKVIGGGHTWPGTKFPAGGSGATNMDINASVEVWRFLRPRYLNLLLSSNAPSRPEPAFTVAPNPAGPNGQVLVAAGRTLRPAQVRLLDALGRPVAVAKTTTTDGVQLDLNGLTSGLYLLQVELNGRQYQQKLLR